MIEFELKLTEDELEILSNALTEHAESPEASVNWKYQQTIERLLDKLAAATP